MPRLLFAFCLCVFTVTLFPGMLSAADWPHWGGDQARNFASTEKCALPESFDVGRTKSKSDEIDPATRRNVKWSAPLGSHTYGNPVVADGRIYVGTNDALLEDKRVPRTHGGLLLCLEEATGKELWRLPAPAPCKKEETK